MAIAKSDIIAKLKTFIEQQFPVRQTSPLTLEHPLLEGGLIDSMGILEVVAFIESEFNITLADEDLTPENFQSLSQLADFVSHKLNS